MSSLMKRDTADDIVRKRNEALRLYDEASKLMKRANELASEATSSANYYAFTAQRTTLSMIGDDRFMPNVRKDLDRYVWLHIANVTRIGDLMNVSQRRMFDAQIEEDPPEVTSETIMSTILSMTANANQMFDDSVYQLYTRLGRRFKSHSGFGFGPRLIFTSVFCFGSVFHQYSQELIWDLERVIAMVNGKSPPERYGGLVGAIRNAEDKMSGGEAETDTIKAKWYKNGNLHITIKDQETVNMMNMHLKRHGDRDLGNQYTG